MNKSTTENFQPERVMNSESEADIIPFAQVSANAVLSAALSVDEILSGNRLIAEFMCWDRTEPTNSTLFEQSIKHTQYHRSWDWLMPVVEKIQKVFHWDSENDKYISVEDFGIVYTRRYPTNMNVTRICICTKLNGAMSEFHHIRKESKSKIESVWLAVVEFIEWYNVNTAVVGSR